MRYCIPYYMSTVLTEYVAWVALLGVAHVRTRSGHGTSVSCGTTPPRPIRNASSSFNAILRACVDTGSRFDRQGGVVRELEVPSSSYL